MLAEEQKGPRGWGRVWIRVRIRQGSHAALAVVIGQLAQDVGRWTAGALDGGALILGSVSSYPQRDRPHSQGTGGWATKPVIIAQHGFYRGARTCGHCYQRSTRGHCYQRSWPCRMLG